MSNKTLDKYRTYGAKEIENIGYYKHIVPTGLKSISHICKTAKLTLMVRLGNRTGSYKETVCERFSTNSVRLGNRQINGMNAFDEYAYGIRHDSPPTVLGYLAFVIKNIRKTEN